MPCHPMSAESDLADPFSPNIFSVDVIHNATEWMSLCRIVPLSILLYFVINFEMMASASGVLNESQSASCKEDFAFMSAVKIESFSPVVLAGCDSISLTPRKKLLTFSSKAFPSLTKSGVISIPSFQVPKRKTIRRLLGVQSPLPSASLIVVKFFNDLAILAPWMERCPICKK